MKKIVITLVSLCLFFLVSCDLRKEMSETKQAELYSMFQMMISNDENWNSNFCYNHEGVIILDTYGEHYISDESFNYNDYLGKKNDFSNLITSIIEEKHNYTIYGITAVGVADIVFINMNDTLKNKYFPDEVSTADISFNFYIETHRLAVSLTTVENDITRSYEFYFFADKNSSRVPVCSFTSDGN